MHALTADTWAGALDKLRNVLGEQRFSLWFAGLRLVRSSDDALTIGAPNLFVQEWIEKHFRDTLRSAVREAAGRAVEVRFTIDPELFREARRRSLSTEAEIIEETAAKRPALNDTHIRSDYTLANFIVGAHNKLAYACAMEILENSSNRLHPCFVQSGSGLGKTHLLQAIWHELQQRNDGRNAVYVSAEMFTNQFVYALRSHRLDAFRSRYRNADILLIDDVHFLRHKSGLQEELLHTFEAVDARGRQIVLASDAHPKALQDVKTSLVNRFASGMIVQIGRPDFATRVSILKARSRQLRRAIPDDVIRYLCRGFEGSIRELIGALTTLMAYSGLTGDKVDIALARRALAETASDRPAASGLARLEAVVGKHFQMDPSAWHGAHLKRTARLPRQAAMYLARKCGGVSCREVARHFGAANHSTVVFAVRRIEEAMAKDAALAARMAGMMDELQRT